MIYKNLTLETFPLFLRKFILLRLRKERTQLFEQRNGENKIERRMKYQARRRNILADLYSILIESQPFLL